MAGAVFGDLAVLLFVAGAVFGEIWIDSRSVKCCNFQYKMRLRFAKSNLGERRVRDDEFMLGSWSDHGRIILESSAIVMTLQSFSANFS